MKDNPYFDLKRFFLMLKRDTNMAVKPTLISFGALIGILLVVTFLDGNNYTYPGGIPLFKGYFFNTLFIGGAIISSLAFKELRNPSSRLNYLMLPASTFEKFLSAWLLTSIGYTLLTWFGIIVLSWICYGLSELYFGLTVEFFRPFRFSDLIREIRMYWVMNSIFLLGAAIFNKYAFPKTIMSIMVAGTIMGLIAGIFARIVFWEYFDGMAMESNNFPEFTVNFVSFMENNFPKISHAAYFWILAPFLWVVTYFHLKERTV